MEHNGTANTRRYWCTRSLQVNKLFSRFDKFGRKEINLYNDAFYRDPRTRRLQEKQQQQQQKSGDGVPEKLSFKEKMKMFALESGENQTPKDKLKISRAQRDIDAVH